MTGKSQVRHGDQLQAAIEDTEDVIALEVELLYIAADLLITGGITKAQITITRIELEQVLGDAVTMTRTQRTNRHQGRRAALGAMGLAHVPQPAGASLPGRFQPVFGDIHALKYR